MTEFRPNNLLVCTLEPVEVGEMFPHLPLHVTVQPWFTLDSTLERSFFNAMSNLTHDLEPIKIVGGEEANYGPNGEVRVRTLRRIGGLASLHAATGELISRFGGKVKSDYIGERYSPHVSYSDGKGLAEGQESILKSLQIFRKQPDGQKRVDRVFYLVKGS